MRYTETISIPWHCFKDDMPEPGREIVTRPTTISNPCQLMGVFYLSTNRVDAFFRESSDHRSWQWAYADEIKSVQSEGRILPEADVLTRDNVSYFAIVSVSCYLFDYEEPYENVIAEVVLKDGTKIPFDVPVFTDIKTACHPHTLFYKGNRYVIDIMPNKDNPAHKEKYRGVIRRCNGTEHPIFVYGNILTFC